jgi:hypothetical protein
MVFWQGNLERINLFTSPQRQHLSATKNGIWGSGNKAPRILTVSIKWKWVVSSTSRLLYSRHLWKEAGLPPELAMTRWQREESVSLPGIEARTASLQPSRLPPPCVYLCIHTYRHVYIYKHDGEMTFPGSSRYSRGAHHLPVLHVSTNCSDNRGRY